MKFVVQRVSSASIDIRDAAFRGSEEAASDVVTRSIGPGFVVLIGISQEDVELFFGNKTDEQSSGKASNKFEIACSTVADKMIHKLVNMRIFDDENGKTNLNIDAVNGEMLLISQFTLYADCKHGNRPSFTNAGDPARAEKLYNYIVDKTRELLDGNKPSDKGKTNDNSITQDNKTSDSRIKTGEFGADMKVSLINDGPFTIILDSSEIV